MTTLFLNDLLFLHGLVLLLLLDHGSVILLLFTFEIKSVSKKHEKNCVDHHFKHAYLAKPQCVALKLACVVSGSDIVATARLHFGEPLLGSAAATAGFAQLAVEAGGALLG